MISMDEMRDMLAELIDELPQAFFSGLDGGVALLPEVKRDPSAPGLYTLGQYIRDCLGTRIVLYYGSFAQLFGELSNLRLRQELRRTLRHEFRHHVEALAGIDDLGIADALAMEAYRRTAAENGSGEAAARKRGCREGRRFFRRKK